MAEPRLDQLTDAERKGCIKRTLGEENPSTLKALLSVSQLDWLGLGQALTSREKIAMVRMLREAQD